MFSFLYCYSFKHHRGIHLYFKHFNPKFTQNIYTLPSYEVGRKLIFTINFAEYFPIMCFQYI